MNLCRNCRHDIPHSNLCKIHSDIEADNSGKTEEILKVDNRTAESLTTEVPINVEDPDGDTIKEVDNTFRWGKDKFNHFGDCADYDEIRIPSSTI